MIEEQRKEMLRIRRENKKTENHEYQRLPTLKRWKRGDDNELESNLRLEKVVASEQLRLAMETEDERRARLENDTAFKRLRLIMETEEERKANLVKMVATTQLRLALMKKWNGLDLDLIWIEIGVFKNFKECARSPCNGNHFSSN